MRLLRFISPAGLLLLPWAALAALVLRRGPYGLTEEGAKALLVAWSIGDQVASTVFTLGAPDVRVFFFLPVGLAWPGQVLAAKGVMVLMMAVAAVALYWWRARGEQDEAALLATGLLMIAPLTIDSIDSLGAGPFLLAIFGTAAWINRKCMEERGTLGGWFFAQLIGCGAAVSLHPAGLAYPVLLMVRWLAEPAERRDRQAALIGIPLIVALVLLMRLGWSGFVWAQNPLPAVAAVFGGSLPEDLWSGATWLGALALVALAIAVAVHEARRLIGDMTGGSLLLGVLFGLIAADRAWAMLSLAMLLYGGFPWLLRACGALSGRGFLIQRGWLWMILFIICTAFMRINKSDFEAGREHLLSTQDQLISDFASGLNEEPSSAKGTQATLASDAAVLVASPWPARTSIACRCAALPLPPAAKDPTSQIAMMGNVSYLILSDSLDSRALANNFSQLGARVEVVSKQTGGVILHFRPTRTDI